MLAFVAAEDPGRAGLAGRQVGQQRVPAVPGGFSVNSILVEVPGQDGFASLADGDGGAEVLPGAAFGGDRLDAGGHGIFGGVEPGPGGAHQFVQFPGRLGQLQRSGLGLAGGVRRGIDRKSTRLNSSHITTSYTVFCLKKKNTTINTTHTHTHTASKRTRTTTIILT